MPPSFRAPALLAGRVDELVWHEEYENVGLAFSREKQVQKWGRTKRLALIDHDYASLPGLAKKDFGRPGRSSG